jgi:hypothetical protein
MDNEKRKETYKYNMALYYQSAIVYFLVFVLYLAVRGRFADGSFNLAFDPIAYFFILILFIAFAAVLYNLFLNRKLEIDDKTISFVDRRKTRSYSMADIISVKIAKDRAYMQNSAFKLIRVRFRNKRGMLIIRPHDYENEKELVNRFKLLKAGLESKNV